MKKAKTKEIRILAEDEKYDDKNTIPSAENTKTKKRNLLLKNTKTQTSPIPKAQDRKICTYRKTSDRLKASGMRGPENSIGTLAFKSKMQTCMVQFVSSRKGEIE